MASPIQAAPASVPAPATASATTGAPAISVDPVTATDTAAAPAATNTTAASSEPAATTRLARNTRSATPQAAARETARTSTATPAVAAAAAPAAAADTAPALPAKASSANILHDPPTRAVEPAPAPQADPATPAQDGIPGVAIAGLLGLLGIGAAGFAATRSRRRRVETDEQVAAEPAFVATERAEAPREEATPAYVAAPVVTARPNRTFATPTAASAMTRAPANAEERAAILDRMVDAAPDEANPFTSRQARRKRARLILQRLEAEGHREAPFDFRSYQSSTAKPSTPAPVKSPLVTA